MTQYEAGQLCAIMDNLEMAILTVVWEEVLKMANKVSEALQQVDLDLCTVICEVREIDI